MKQVSWNFLCLFHNFPWPRKKEPAAQFVVHDSYELAVLNLVHDTVVAGNPGRDRTSTAARTARAGVNGLYYAGNRPRASFMEQPLV